MTPYEQAKRNLIDFSSILATHKVPFCLMDGTLLGACREKDFIKGDEKDIDTAILDYHYDVFVAQLLPKLREIGFNDIRIYSVDGTVEGVAMFRGNNHIDVMRIHIKNDYAYNLAKSFGRFRQPHIAFKYPVECFREFDEIEFLGATYNTPHDPERYLEVRYADWKTPVAQKDYDYFDQKQVPCLSLEW